MASRAIAADRAHWSARQTSSSVGIGRDLALAPRRPMATASAGAVAAAATAAAAAVLVIVVVAVVPQMTPMADID